MLQQGVPVPHGPIALIGAGTGLGQGYLLWDGSRYVVHPSEGGHADFSPTDALQRDRSPARRGIRPGISERILSGDGIARIYDTSHRGQRQEMAGTTPPR